MRSLVLFSASMGCQHGGTETYVQTLAQQLLGKVPEIGLVTGGAGCTLTPDYARLMQTADFRHCLFPMLGRQSSLGKLLSRSSLGRRLCPTDLESLSAVMSWRRIRNFARGAQLIEAHYPLEGLMFPLLPREMAKVLHFHGAWPSPLFRKLSKIILSHTDCCIACSHYARDEILRVLPSAAIEVVYNGVDVETFSPGDSKYTPNCSYVPGRLKVGTVARLSRDKGTDLLCRVAARMRDDLELFLAGPVETNFLMELEKYSGLPNIHYLGQVDHSRIHDFYRFLDCFVLPTNFDAFPLTVLEAMACGCSVIASRVGGIPEIIGPREEAGVLLPCGDEEELVKQLGRMIENRDVFKQMGSLGRSRVLEFFSLKRTADKAFEVFQRVLRDREMAENR